MSFLSLAFLAALPLAAAPILLHLFDRRRNVVIEWGAMEFLLEASSQKTAARKLKQWLLVLLRVLTVLALVFALARPTLTGNWFGSGERCETIFILDNSMSMQRGGADASRFDEARRQIVASIDGLPDGDSVRILLSAPYPVWATSGSVRVDPGSRGRIAAQLDALASVDGGGDVLASLFSALQAERPPTDARRRIVLLTDGQGSDWNSSDDAGWRRFYEELRSTPLPTELEIVELPGASSGRNNLAVNEIHSNRFVVGVDQVFRLTAQIENYGQSSSAPASVRWKIGDRILQESQVSALEAGTRHDVHWPHSFSEPGTYAIQCELAAGDALAADNRATIVIEVAEEIPFLLVESSPELSETQRDAFFVETALGWQDGHPLDERSVLSPRLISPDQLESLDLSRQRAVVIPHFRSLSAEAARRLQEFVYDGGGVWIALGPRTDAESFNQYLFADGRGLAPLAVERIRNRDVSGQVAAANRQPTRINPFQGTHPATTHLTDTDKLDTGEVAVTRYWSFAAAPEGDDVSELLGLTDGDPLSVEKTYGLGRVIVQAIPLRLQWSDLARSQAFVVMVQDWLAYLAQPKAIRHNLASGDPIRLELDDDGVRNATLRTPHGDEIELAGDVRGEQVVFQSGRTVVPGDYEVELGTTGRRIPFHVNRNPAESDLTPLSDAGRERVTALTELKPDPDVEKQQAAALTEPVWPMLLLLLIALIAGELLLSGMIARDRFGADPIAETTEAAGAAFTSFASAAGPAASRRAARSPSEETIEAGT